MVGKSWALFFRTCLALILASSLLLASSLEPVVAQEKKPATGTGPRLVEAPASPTGTQFVNGGFEAMPLGTGWTTYSSQGQPLIYDENDPLLTYVDAHDGQYLAWLGGVDDEVSYVEQQVTITAETPRLSYWWWIETDEVQCNKDFITLKVNDVPILSSPLCTVVNTLGWVKFVLGLSAYIGQDVMITLRVQTDANILSHVYVDDFALEPAPSFVFVFLPLILR